LLRHLDEDAAPATPTARVLTSTALPSGAAPGAAAAPQPAPRHVHTPVAAPPPAAVTPPMPAGNSDELQLPLQPILASLPMELRAKIMQTPPPDALISIPLEKILTQLAFGSVKINFGELRNAAPGLFVNSGGEHDHKPVTLPLNEILTRLNPARFSRRAAQKHFEVADDIIAPFGPGGQGAKISTPGKPTPSTTLTQRTTAQSLRMVAPVAPAPEPPTPVAPPPPAFVPRVVAPAAGVTAPPSSLSHDTSLVANLAPVRSNGAPKPIAPPPPPPAPIPKAPAPVPTAQVAADPTALPAPLAALSEHWPEGLRLEIIQSNLASAQVLLPLNLIEPALKRGRITLTWRNVRPLIKPTPPPTSIHDSVELELPLNVIAPLFFARQKTAPRPQPASSPAAEIPNLFFGFPQPESSPAPAPLKMSAPPPAPPEPEPPIFRRAPEPSSLRIAPEPPVFRPMPEPPPVQSAPEPQAVRPPSPPPRPVAKPLDAKIADSNYYIWGDDGEAPRVDETEYRHIQRPATDFTSRYATPKEIVGRAMALTGVVGVLVALPDGLLVASQVPAEFNAENLAAFLPQIFDRVSQSTKELRMGALNNFNFTVGNVPWRIFRVNAVYFAAFGSAGESLPGAQLAALAAELDRKKS
jgi:predicted regulator of Ras-like GTPase activity (Roadblock/LC7/MglB family)